MRRINIKNILYSIIAFIIISLVLKFRKDISSFLKMFSKGKSNQDASPMIGVTEQLYKAMDGVGTDEKTIKALCKNLTSSQLNEVYKVFGLRPYSEYPLYGGGAGWSIFGAKNLDLFGWFAREMSGQDLVELRDIWVKSGLTITF